jgi:hypothetical protein
VKPPILRCSVGEIEVYDSVEAVFAGREIGHYKYCSYYDGEGRRLKLVITKVSQGLMRPKQALASFEVESDTSQDPLELKILIIEFFQLAPEYGLSAERAAELSLNELIARLTSKTDVYRPPLFVCPYTGDIEVVDSLETLFYAVSKLQCGCELYDSQGLRLDLSTSDINQEDKVSNATLELRQPKIDSSLSLKFFIIRFFVRHPEHGWSNESVFHLDWQELMAELINKVGIRTIHSVS